MLLVTSLSQRSVTRWRARAARDCLASSLARCDHLQQCITGNQSVCTNQFGTESTRKKQQYTVGCSRLFTQLSHRNRYTSSTILKQHSPRDFLHNCGGDTTTIWGTLHTTNKSRVSLAISVRFRQQSPSSILRINTPLWLSQVFW